MALLVTALLVTTRTDAPRGVSEWLENFNFYLSKQQ